MHLRRRGGGGREDVKRLFLTGPAGRAYPPNFKMGLGSVHPPALEERVSERRTGQTCGHGHGHA